MHPLSHLISSQQRHTRQQAARHRRSNAQNRGAAYRIEAEASRTKPSGFWSTRRSRLVAVVTFGAGQRTR